MSKKIIQCGKNSIFVDVTNGLWIFITKENTPQVLDMHIFTVPVQKETKSGLIFRERRENT